MMSTNERANNSLIGIFTDCRERSRHIEYECALPRVPPPRRINRFRGRNACQKEKRTLPRVRASVSRLACVATQYPQPGSGMLTGFPFDKRSRLPGKTRPDDSLSNGILLSLRIDSPVFNHCSHGTFLHFSLQSSHLNICYYHQDLH